MCFPIMAGFACLCFIAASKRPSSVCRGVVVDRHRFNQVDSKPRRGLLGFLVPRLGAPHIAAKPSAGTGVHWVVTTPFAKRPWQYLSTAKGVCTGRWNPDNNSTWFSTATLFRIIISKPVFWPSLGLRCSLHPSPSPSHLSCRHVYDHAICR